MEQSNNDEIVVKHYRKTGQATGMIGKITLHCSLGEIGLNVFKSEDGKIEPSQQSFILTHEERKIIETYGTNKITQVISNYLKSDSKDQTNINEETQYKYMLLDRLRNDCDYFLGYGNRQEKYLWAENIQDHITQMKELYNSFTEDEKPEWLSMQDIEEYEKKMKGV